MTGRLRLSALACLLLASCTADNPSFIANALTCSAGERACVGARPVECDLGDGGAALQNAACPSSGTCGMGHCLPPKGATACQLDGDCAPGACEAFVDSTGLHIQTFCGAVEGNTPGAERCKTDGECRSGLCLKASTQTGGQAAEGLCFLSCRSNRDCNILLVCRAFDVTVTGIRGTLSACASP